MGYIYLHRKLREHWLYTENREFTKLEAWIDLLFEVNHKDNKFLLGSELVYVKRGSTITSKRKLSEKWKWSTNKVETFLKNLKVDGMLSYKSDTKKTVITIENYEKYQYQKKEMKHQKDTDETQTKHKRNTDETQTKHRRKQTINEVINEETNEVINEEITTNNFVLHTQHFNLSLTETEYEKLCEKHGKDIVDDKIETVKSYSKDYLKKYSSFKSVLDNWIKSSTNNKFKSKEEQQEEEKRKISEWAKTPQPEKKHEEKRKLTPYELSKLSPDEYMKYVEENGY